MLGFTPRKSSSSGIAHSKLYDNTTFYSALEKDIASCKYEAIIESPFITMRRLRSLLPCIQHARSKGINFVVNTKSPDEHEAFLRFEAERAIDKLQEIGVKILFTGGHHRKLAIFDRQILWEGSLNILSQNDSCEIMRRTESEDMAWQTIRFIGIKDYLEREPSIQPISLR